MLDERKRHLRRLDRLRRAARRWSVLAGSLGGASAVLVPYHGLGVADAAWLAAAGGTAVLAGWRWIDFRAFAALPTPPPPDPALAAAQSRERLAAALSRLPGGRAAVEELRRHKARLDLRGLTVAPLWARLDRASVTFAGFTPGLDGPASFVAAEAATAERSLRALATRTASVERALRVAPDDARPELEQAHHALLAQLADGVTAYERLVAASAGYVAENGHTAVDDHAVGRLTEATDLLRGVAAGLSELRTVRLQSPGVGA